MNTPSRTVRVFALLMLATAGLFGLLVISYPISMARGQWPLSSLLMAKLTSVDFFMVNEQTVRKVTLNYTRGFGGISMHTMLGGFGLATCTLQLFPELRRRWPRLHRGIGFVAIACTALSMIGALWFLAGTPAADNISGHAFAAALWMLAISTLLALGMAVSSIRRRKIRAHMGWMALMTACLMTAPLLRIEDVVLAHLLPLNMVQANAALSTMLMPQAVLLMAWWMQQMGRQDLSLLPAQPSLSPSMLRGMVWLGVATVVHEGLLAPWGMDVLAHWRGDSERLPVMAAPWALATAALLPRLNVDLCEVLHGAPARVESLVLMAMAGFGALLVTLHWLPGGQLPQDIHQTEKLFFWAAFGTSNALYALSGLIWRKAHRAQGRWRILGLMNALAPALWLPYGLAMAWTDWPVAAITSAALNLSWGMMAWQGFMTAFGLPQPGKSLA